MQPGGRVPPTPGLPSSPDGFTASDDSHENPARMLMSDSHPTAIPASAGAQFGNCKRFLCLDVSETREAGNTAQLNVCPSRVQLPGLGLACLFISLLTIHPPPFAWWSLEPPGPQVPTECHTFTTWALLLTAWSLRAELSVCVYVSVCARVCACMQACMHSCVCV